jgi:hypothetical protein
LNPTLDAYVSADPRILQVYREAKRRYAEAGRPHHNFNHVMRDLHRAFLIAQEEEGVNYTVKIAPTTGSRNPTFGRSASRTSEALPSGPKGKNPFLRSKGSGLVFSMIYLRGSSAPSRCSPRLPSGPGVSPTDKS